LKKIIILVILGTLSGLAYYNYFGCTSGCSLQSSPYIMSFYGGLIGLTLGFPTKKKK
jgi:hypothetical protein